MGEFTVRIESAPGALDDGEAFERLADTVYDDGLIAPALFSGDDGSFSIVANVRAADPRDASTAAGDFTREALLRAGVPSTSLTIYVDTSDEDQFARVLIGGALVGLVVLIALRVRDELRIAA